MSHSVNAFLIHYGLIALFLLALVKAIGVPIPVPVDLLVLAAATGSASGKFVLWQAFVVLLVAMVCGGTIQFGLARGPGRNVLYRFGRHIGLTPSRLDLAFERVQNVGILGIAVAVVTPGIRTAAIPACGLTTIPLTTFAVGLAVGTTCFLSLQFFLGYAGVKLILRFWNGEPRVWLLLAIIPMALLITWMVVRHTNRHVGVAAPFQVHPSPLCPLCWLVSAGDLLARRKGRNELARLQGHEVDHLSDSHALRRQPLSVEANSSEPNPRR